MTTTPPLTRDIGRTERTLQTLIGQQLDRAGVTFPEWVALTFLSGSGPLSGTELAHRLVDDAVAPVGHAQAVVGALIGRGWAASHASDLVDSDAATLTITDDGAAVYGALRATIGRLTERLFAGIEPVDLDATRRTLREVRRRAARLAA